MNHKRSWSITIGQWLSLTLSSYMNTTWTLFSRRMNRLLKEQGTNVTYTEIAGKEHWWWDTW